MKTLPKGMQARRVRDILDVIEWAEEHFGSLTTNRQIRKRDVLLLVSFGLVKSIGMVSLCDGDGAMLDPERHAEGFKMTKAGRDKLAQLRLDIPTP